MNKKCAYTMVRSKYNPGVCGGPWWESPGYYASGASLYACENHKRWRQSLDPFSSILWRKVKAPERKA